MSNNTFIRFCRFGFWFRICGYGFGLWINNEFDRMILGHIRPGWRVRRWIGGRFYKP